MVNERIYEYLVTAGTKLYYDRRLRIRMQELTVLDFYLADRAIEGSNPLNNEWFLVCRVDEFYFNCIELLKTDKHFIDTYSIGDIEDKLVVIRMKGVREEALDALMFNEFSYMYPKEDLTKRKELFLEFKQGTGKLVPDDLWGVLYHSTEQFNKLVKKFGLDEEDDEELIETLRHKEYAEQINKENIYFNSKEYDEQH